MRAPSPAHTAATPDTIVRSRVTKTLQPGQPGTGRWQQAYGDQLVCVRYREDLQRGERHVTVELVLATRPLARRYPAPPAHDPHEEVGVRIGRGELHERAQAKQAGARWNPTTLLWHMPRDIAESLDWHPRIVRL